MAMARSLRLPGSAGQTFSLSRTTTSTQDSWGGGGEGGIDAFAGGKYVFRHNRMFNATTLGHSTGATRGQRVEA